MADYAQMRPERRPSEQTRTKPGSARHADLEKRSAAEFELAHMLNARAQMAHRSAPGSAPIQRMIEASQFPQIGDEVVHHTGDETHVDTKIVGKVTKVDDRSVQFRPVGAKEGAALKWARFKEFQWSLERFREKGEATFRLKPEIEREDWAILQYTQDEHLWINQMLRQPNVPLDHGYATKRDRFLATARDNHDITDFAHLIETIERGLRRREQPLLARQTLPEPVTRHTGGNSVVSKGVNLRSDNLVAPRYTLEDHTPGRDFVVREFNSTSYGTPFLNRDSLIFYKLPAIHAGRDIKEDSSKGNENELLFPPGMRYRTLARYDRPSVEFLAILAHFNAGENETIQHVLIVEVNPPPAHRADDEAAGPSSVPAPSPAPAPAPRADRPAGKE